MTFVENVYKAFEEFQNIDLITRSNFLKSIADEIEACGQNLLETASEESNLPIARFEGERGRTCMQLRMFADYILEGSWLNASIDAGDADRKPLAKPDLRKINIGIGPIVVFGASNFPLAYSTAGGDTASALAAGCPVIYKAHPAHPKTSALVAKAIENAIAINQMPGDVFTHFISDSFDEVKKLIQHPKIKGVGFTGSLQGGMSIYEYAKSRVEPIPVFCEMGSTNPVILLPNALAEMAEEWAVHYSSAITMGVGQFCTNPGLLLGIKSKSLDRFIDTLSEKIASGKDFKMLHSGIYKNYENKKSEALMVSGVTMISSGHQNGLETAIPTLAKVDSNVFINKPILHEEVFGPYSLIVECNDFADLSNVLNVLNGQLTSSIIHHEGDEHEVNELTKVLKHKAGRIIYNGVPTGVEVNTSMVHGGTFPAVTDCRFTAVGHDAIMRWLRPISFQNCHESMLPDYLRNENISGIWRRINGKLTKASI